MLSEAPLRGAPAGLKLVSVIGEASVSGLPHNHSPGNGFGTAVGRRATAKEPVRSTFPDVSRVR